MVGGGFGGVNVTRKLAKVDVDVTIVDRPNDHLFQPPLYQVATVDRAGGSDFAGAAAGWCATKRTRRWCSVR